MKTFKKLILSCVALTCSCAVSQTCPSNNVMTGTGLYTQPICTPISSLPGGMIYPALGVAASTGTAWGSSYTTSGAGTTLLLSDSPNITGNSGLPARTDTGTLWIGSGYASPVIGKLYVGDGTGWEFDFASREASVDTSVVRFFDNGNATFNGAVNAGGFQTGITEENAIIANPTNITGYNADGNASWQITNATGVGSFAAVNATSYSQTGSTVGRLCNGGSTGTFTTSSGPCSGSTDAIEISFPYLEQIPNSADVTIATHMFTQTTVCDVTHLMYGQAYAEATTTTDTEFIVVAVLPVEGSPAKTLLNLSFPANAATGVFSADATGTQTFSPGDYIRLMTSVGNTPGLAGLSVSLQCSVSH